MNGPEVLVLHGSPGSGKTTLSRAVAELLREAELPNAAIDLDDLSTIYPHPPHSFARANLAAIWPNYAAVPQLKVIIPSVIADVEERQLLREAVPASRFLVCELTAPEAVLKERVTEREPNEYWRQILREFVDLYHSRTDLATIRDFQVSTHDRSVDEAAQEVVAKAGWLPADGSKDSEPCPTPKPLLDRLRALDAELPAGPPDFRAPDTLADARRAVIERDAIPGFRVLDLATAYAPRRTATG